MLAPARGNFRGSGLPPWMQPLAQRLSPAVKFIIVMEALAFATYLLAPPVRFVVDEYLALGPGILKGFFWQPFSSLFVHNDFLSFAFNVIGLWFIGAGIEATQGQRRFLRLFFVPAVVGGVVQVVAGVAIGRGEEIVAGCGLGILALFVAFGVQYGRTQARVLGGLVLEARTLAAILVGFSIVIGLAQGAFHHVVGMVVACALAFLLSGGRARDVASVFFSHSRVRGAGSARTRYTVIEGGKGRSRCDERDRYLN